MKNNNRKLLYFLDGFVYIYRYNENNKSSFGAKTNVREKEEMELIYKLAYSQTYKRLDDIDFCETQGRNLTLKIKVPLVKGILNSDKILIDNMLYDIIYIDEDRINQELYIYLEEVRKIE